MCFLYTKSYTFHHCVLISVTLTPQVEPEPEPVPEVVKPVAARNPTMSASFARLTALRKPARQSKYSILHTKLNKFDYLTHTML